MSHQHRGFIGEAPRNLILSKKVSGTNPTGSIPLSELISYGEE